MRTVVIISGILLLIYCSTLLFTEYSLTGFWSDIVFFSTLIIILMISLYKIQKDHQGIIQALRVLSLCLFALTVCYFGYILINPFDIRKGTKTLKSQVVLGRHFHAYFQPTGAWGKGYGPFWITESPEYFPFIERTVFAERGTDYDFNAAEFDGTPVDEIVRNYIVHDIIKPK